MARRWIEQTLHTGQVAYLHARGLLELDFPVLVRPVDNRYNYVVARSPFQDNANLFYSIWQPSQSMVNLTGQAFREWYTGQPQYIDDERVMWEAVRRVHALASSAQPANQQRAAQVVGRVASYLTQQGNQNVPPVSLAVVAEIHAWLGELIF